MEARDTLGFNILFYDSKGLCHKKNIFLMVYVYNVESIYFLYMGCGFNTFLVSFLIGKLNTKFLIASFKKLTKFKNPFLSKSLLRHSKTRKLAPKPGCDFENCSLNSQ